MKLDTTMLQIVCLSLCLYVNMTVCQRLGEKEKDTDGHKQEKKDPLCALAMSEVIFLSGF